MAEWTETKEVTFLFDIGHEDGEQEFTAEVEVQYSGGAVLTIPRVEEVEILSVVDGDGADVDWEKLGMSECINSIVE